MEIVNEEETVHDQEMVESNELEEDEEDFYHTMFSSVQEMYKEGLFCDLVYCQQVAPSMRKQSIKGR